MVGDGPDRYEEQAATPGRVIAECLAVCRDITFWGFTDRYTWLDSFLRPGTEPLLLDREYRPKPAVATIRDRLAAYGST